MPKITYKKHNFHIDGIIADYQAQGYQLTIRQVYYQLVSKDLLENTEKNYKKIGDIIKNGRLAGLIDWNAIEDRSRGFNNISTWDTPADIIKSAADSYLRDLWEDQEYYLETWVEKQALESIIENTSKALDVQSFACKGYPSITALWEAVQYRYKAITKQGRTVIILYLGDHDPSGLNMDTTNRNHLITFSESPHIYFERIALTKEQIEEYDPPPNPAKITDPRAANYIAEHGPYSWELDALEPAVLDALITDAIKSYLDPKKYNEAFERQEAERESITALLESFEK
jgi:hypothetical protein